MNIALILRLVDRATGPAKQALQQVERVSNQIGQAGLRNLERADAIGEMADRQQARIVGQAAGLASMAAGFWAMTEPAIEAEARMAEIAKVVVFDGENGFVDLQRDIAALVTSGGLYATSQGIMDIVAAAGRMGVVDANLPDAEKRAQLLEFAEAATVMGVALGVSAETAGETLARWRANLNLTQDEAMQLGDMVNLLGNTMATNEADILAVLNRQAVLSDVSGLATSEIAALSATLLAAGSSPEIAATGMKNFINAMTVGRSATARQKAVFQELGIDAEDLARAMQEDASGAILSVLDALNEMEPYRRSSLVGDLFGEEGKAAIIPLIAQTDTLRAALAATADSAALLGLMEMEYARQVETTKAQRAHTIEYFKTLSVVVGAQLLPMLNDMLETIMPVIGRTVEWAEANPELIQQLGWLAAGLFGLSVASFAVKLALLPVLRLVSVGVRLFGWMQIALGVAGRAASALGRGLILLATNPVAALGRLWAATGIVGRALIWLGRLAMRHPLILTLALIAYAVDAIYQNWDGIVAYFTDKVDRVKAAFQDGLIDGVFQVIKDFNGFTLIFDAASGFLEYLTGWSFDDVAASIASITDHPWFDMGVEMIQSLGAGIWSVLTGLVETIKASLAAIVPQWMIDGIALIKGDGDSAELVSPDVNTFDRGARDYPFSPHFTQADQMRVLGGRALGGPVRAGGIYEVNERGQEFFAPGQSGSIITARDARRAGAATSRTVTFGDIVINAAPGMDAQAVARAIKRELADLMDTSRALHDGGFYE
ncbi:hypothetical protein AN189_18490 [Loktanella sp. 3ANDIMAR09]|nr:hypothetical protein AN189_18490 [Loktanella sp. 3ANDIMAR09]